METSFLEELTLLWLVPGQVLVLQTLVAALAPSCMHNASTCFARCWLANMCFFDHVQFFDSVYGSLCVQMHVYAIHASACAVLLPLYNCLCMMHAMYHNAIVQCML